MNCELDNKNEKSENPDLMLFTVELFIEYPKEMD